MKKLFVLTLTGLIFVLQTIAYVEVGLAGEGDGHQIRRRPFELGVSGGNVNNRTLFSCCSGTIGALLTTPDGLALLSNNHIFGRYTDQSIGEDVDQPGIIERSCRTEPADFVGQVSAFVSVDFSGGDNVVDAAIATPLPDVVREDGFILEIGVPSSQPVEPALGMAVKKSGRTTGLTFGTIAGLNLTTNVIARRPCGSVDGTARFVGQIRVTPGAFIAGGDSGSLMVEDVDECPRPVGLLFAGSPSSAVANPLQPVLDAFSAQFVGCSASGATQQSKWELTVNHPQVKKVIEFQTTITGELFNLPGVVGTGVELVDGKPGLVVYLEDEAAASNVVLPSKFDDIGIATLVTGLPVAE